MVHKDIYNTIRKNIKKYRVLSGKTQMQLAEDIDKTHDFIRQIESEKIVKNCSIQTLYDISIALNIDIGLLFADEEETK